MLRSVAAPSLVTEARTAAFRGATSSAYIVYRRSVITVRVVAGPSVYTRAVIVGTVVTQRMEHAMNDETVAGDVLGWMTVDAAGAGRALSAAIAAGDLAGARAASAAGADLEAGLTAGGSNALQLAAYDGQTEIVRWLLVEAGAAVNARRPTNGFSALHLAAHQGHDAVVQILLSAGADTAAKTLQGDDALEIALRHKYGRIVRQLLPGSASPAQTRQAQQLDSTSIRREAALDRERRLVAMRDRLAKALSNPQPEPELQPNNRPLRILCIDGGGIKGLVPALILQRIERQTRRPIRELFDLVCGSSTGGIIALGTCINHQDINDIVSVYEQQASTIFPNDGAKRWRGAAVGLGAGMGATLGGGLGAGMGAGMGAAAGAAVAGAARLLSDPPPRHTANGLEQILQRFSVNSESGQQRTMADPHREGIVPVPKVFVVAAEDTGCCYKPHLFRNYVNHGIHSTAGSNTGKVWEVGRATSAAPTVLPPISIDGTKYVDGGLVANNPVQYAMREVRDIWPDRNVGVIVSLGCGCGNKANTRTLWLPEKFAGTMADPERLHADTMAQLDPADACQLSRSDSGGVSVSATARRDFPGCKYLRLNPVLSHSEAIQMDTTNSAALAALRESTLRFLSQEDVERSLAEVYPNLVR